MMVEDASTFLALLVGEWRGTGRGGFPTLEPFAYREVLRFEAIAGDPSLRYEQRTFRLDPDGRDAGPLHIEAGFLFADEDRLELLNAQNSRRVEVLAGKVARTADGLEARVSSVLLGHDPRMRTSARRLMVSRDTLRYWVEMATTRVPESSSHLSAELTRLAL